MSLHYVIVADLANTHNDTANIDVVTDVPLAGVQASFIIAGQTFSVPFNANRFATSPDVLVLVPSMALPTLAAATLVDRQQPPSPSSIGRSRRSGRGSLISLPLTP